MKGLNKPVFVTLLLLLLSPCITADTFKNITTGESFDGFATQRKTSNKTSVYNVNEKKFKLLDLTEYEVTYNEKGRKNTVILVPVNEAETLLSVKISQTIAKTIQNLSNKGPRLIIVQIDSSGGSANNMKTIASAIKQTTNCPIVAFIDSKKFGGAFSSAAVLALACDKIYISPTASIGAIGPFADQLSSPEQYTEYMNTYYPEMLVTYASYASALAQDNKRNGAVAKALLDKRVSLIEVKNFDGSTAVIEKGNMQPTQTIIKTICEGYDPSRDSLEPTDINQSDPPIEGGYIPQPTPTPNLAHAGRTLMLTSAEAVRLKIADMQVTSPRDIMLDMNVKDANLANAPGISGLTKKFTAAKRNITQAMLQIDYLNEQATVLKKQLSEVENNIRTGTRNTEIATNNRSRRSRTDNQYQQSPSTNVLSNRSRRNSARYETVTTDQPNYSAYQLRQELIYVLDNLVIQYRKTLGQAKRWPGALPTGMSVTFIESQVNSNNMLSQNLKNIQFTIENQANYGNNNRMNY